MSVIGIVSVPKKNKSVKERIFYSDKIKERFGDNPEFMVAELPYCRDRLLRCKNIKKLLNRANEILKLNGADRAVCTRELKELFPYIETESETFVPPQKICECILYVYDKVSAEKRFNSLAIYDRQLESVSHNNLGRLCRYFKDIRIVTERVFEANKICDAVFADYGICISVSENGETHRNSRCITADVDAGIVRAGDFTINGVEALCDTGVYETDGMDVTCAMLKDRYADFKIKNYISGKNRLTIND